MSKDVRLVISGTYSTGKTTTATALSIATGIPLINALSAREILTSLYPGRRFQDMTATELMALGLKRLEERIKAETILYNNGGNFISDGSVLNEFVYGTVRLKIGLNPGSKMIHQIVKALMGLTSKPFFRKYMEAYGHVTKQHAQHWYTDVVHLPIEFEMSSDGHRPVSEKYRILSDRELVSNFESLNFSPSFISGNQVERISKIIEKFNLPIVIPVDEAVKQAEILINKNRESISKKIIEQYDEPTLKQKIKIMSEF